MDNIIEYINNTGCEFIGVHTQYVDKTPIHYKLNIRCKQCAQIFVQSYRDFRQQKKHQCKQCTYAANGRKRTNSQSQIEKIVHDAGCELISQYVNSHTPMRIRCGCGAVFARTLSDVRSILRNGRPLVCPKCAKERVAYNQTLSMSEVTEFVHSTGCKLISTSYAGNMDKLLIQCRLCGTVFANTLKDFKNNGTFACTECTRTNISIEEKRIANWLRDLGIRVSENDRTVLGGKELDILLPDYNLAIEYNGVHYHTEEYGRHRRYHLDKTNACKDVGIRLIQLWDVEWRRSPEICKSMILARLGKAHKVNGRSCTVRRIDDRQLVMRFLDDNHLQQSDASTIWYGLWHRGELISVMTFCVPRYNKLFQYEISRFCTKCGVVVRGGASKMFSRFIRDLRPTNVVTYADLRYATGAVYANMGFKYVRQNPPGYAYEKNGRLYNRLQFQKHKLIKRFGDAACIGKTESQIMIDQKFSRLWDCGTAVYEWSST